MINVRVEKGKVTGEIEGTLNDICNDVFHITRSLMEHLCQTNRLAAIIVKKDIEAWLGELDVFNIQREETEHSVTYDLSRLRNVLGQIMNFNNEKENEENDAD